MFDISYQIQYRSGQSSSGKIKTRLGQSNQQLKIKILEKQGVKRIDEFAFEPHLQKVTSQIKNVNLQYQQKTSKKSSQFLEQSYESQYDETTYLLQQPQKPPLVKGPVREPFPLFSCFSSMKYLLIRPTQLQFYSNNQYNYPPDNVLPFSQIKEITSYRKKSSYHLRIIQKNNSFRDFRFNSRDVCKQWMGYLIQATQFNKYLQQKRLYSKAQSFKNILKELKEEQKSTNIVELEDNSKVENSLFDELLIDNPHINQPQKTPMMLSQFDISFKIGSGSFSIIYLANINEKQYALKQMNKDKLFSKNQLKYAYTELNVLIKAKSCPYILQLYNSFQTRDNLYLTLEYLPLSDLSTYIHSLGTFSIPDSLIFLCQLVATIQHLHSLKIIYRDLKPDNILIDAEGHIRLADFGLAKELEKQDDFAESFLGTPLYLAPERFEGSGSINFKSDIYGVGCLFYFVLHGNSPFVANNMNSVIYKIKNQEIEIDQNLPSIYKSFLNQTLQKEPEKRLRKMSQHQIFRDVKWKDIMNKKQSGMKLKLLSKYKESISNQSFVKINFQVDEDYNDQTYPQKKVKGWDTISQNI